MKNHKIFAAILLIACSSANAKDNVKPKSTANNYSSESGYEIDGSTSASKLAAKRSHSVSKSDETGLSIFLGVIVIGLIVFFLKPFSDKN